MASSVRKICGKVVKGIKPQYLTAFHQEFVDTFLKPRRGKNGVWFRPVLGAMQVAALRKETLMEHGVWPYEKERRPQQLRVKFKGRRHELGKEERQAMIEENLKDMDEKIAAHKKELRDARPKMDTMYNAMKLFEIEPALLEKEKGGKKKKNKK
eukprot:jgi/Bigna1/89562/estExt_fgenesh1_pg.C_510123